MTTNDIVQKLKGIANSSKNNLNHQERAFLKEVAVKLSRQQNRAEEIIKCAFDHHYDGLCQIETFPDMQPPKWKAVTDAIEADIERIMRENDENRSD